MATLLQRLGLVAGLGLAGVVGVASGYETRVERKIRADGIEKVQDTNLGTDIYSIGSCDRGSSLFATQTDYFNVSQVWDVPVHSQFSYSVRETFACDGSGPVGRRIIYADGTEHSLPADRPSPRNVKNQGYNLPMNGAM